VPRLALIVILAMMFLASSALAQNDFPEGQAKEYMIQICKALIVFREKHGEFRQWGAMLVIYGVDGLKIEAAKDNLTFQLHGHAAV
jgi:hypothetical protein